MNSTEPKLYIMYYKMGTVLELDSLYQPLFCGGVPEAKSLGYLTDDSGESISEKNSSYSELTGIYWMWKNTAHSITGACHYRRYFTCMEEPWYHWWKNLIKHPFHKHPPKSPLIYTTHVRKYLPHILTKQQLETIFEEYEGVLPEPRRFKYSVRAHYRKYHDIRDLDILQQLITEKCPDYLSAYHQVMEGNSLYANNMFILKEPHYQAFMEWWFEMLFEYERQIDLKNYTEYQQRILGFIAERLLTVWFKKNALHIKELQLIYFKKFKNE